MELIKFVEQLEQMTSNIALSRVQHLELIKGFAALKQELNKKSSEEQTEKAGN